MGMPSMFRRPRSVRRVRESFGTQQAFRRNARRASLNGIAAACLSVLIVGCGGDGGPTPPPRFEVNVSFDSQPQLGLPATLCGTFSAPSETSRGLPGVLLIGGSDPLNREGATTGVPYFEQPLDNLDSTLDGRLSYSPSIDVFTAMAHDLTDAGFAVLRYDNRSWLSTHGSSCGPNPGSGTFTTYAQDFVIDSSFGLSYLNSRPEVEFGRLYVVGLGLGALTALFQASQPTPISGAVMIDAPSRPIDQVTLDFLNRRLAYLRTLPSTGPVEQAIEAQVAQIADAENGFALARQGRFPVTRQMLGWSKFYWENQIIFTDQTLPIFRRITTRPLLFIHATKDYEFPVSEMNAFGPPGQTGRVTTVTVPTASSLNAVSANTFERSVSPQVLGLIRDWLRSH